MGLQGRARQGGGRSVRPRVAAALGAGGWAGALVSSCEPLETTGGFHPEQQKVPWVAIKRMDDEGKAGAGSHIVLDVWLVQYQNSHISPHLTCTGGPSGAVQHRVPGPGGRGTAMPPAVLGPWCACDWLTPSPPCLPRRGQRPRTEGGCVEGAVGHGVPEIQGGEGRLAMLLW